MRSLATISSLPADPSPSASSEYISRTFPLAIKGRSARLVTRGDATSARGRTRPDARAASGPVGAARSGDLLEARDDLLRVADVVPEVEDRVEVEAGGALVGRQQLAHRDALVPCVLGELLDHAVGVVALGAG